MTALMRLAIFLVEMQIKAKTFFQSFMYSHKLCFRIGEKSYFTHN